MYALETNNLEKKYKSFAAIKDLNMRIEKGEIYGLIREKWSWKDYSN